MFKIFILICICTCAYTRAEDNPASKVVDDERYVQTLKKIEKILETDENIEEVFVMETPVIKEDIKVETSEGKTNILENQTNDADLYTIQKAKNEIKVWIDKVDCKDYLNKLKCLMVKKVLKNFVDYADRMDPETMQERVKLLLKKLPLEKNLDASILNILKKFNVY